MSLGRYRNYATYFKDIELIRGSDLFNNHYYGTYHPFLKKYPLCMYLHYLVSGGFNGSDPGPTFDSSWYLEHNADVNSSRTNPLIHYLQVGEKENRATYSEFGLKIIEFIGLSGSGKSSVYKLLNRYLEKYLGYKPGPTKSLLSLHQDVRFRAMMDVDGLSNLSSGSDHIQLVDAFREAIDQFPYPDYFPKNRPERVSSFISTIRKFIAQVEKDRTKNWLIFDEGLSLYLLRFILQKDRIDEGTYNIIVTALPQVEVFIYIKTDVTKCIQRMKKRSIPRPFQGLPDDILYSHFIQGDMAYTDFVNLMRERGVKTITIENNGSLEESFSILKGELSKLSLFAG
jgi:hypothetical protein